MTSQTRRSRTVVFSVEKSEVGFGCGGFVVVLSLPNPTTISLSKQRGVFALPQVFSFPPTIPFCKTPRSTRMNMELLPWSLPWLLGHLFETLFQFLTLRLPWSPATCAGPGRLRCHMMRMRKDIFEWNMNGICLPDFMRVLSFDLLAI